MALNLLVKQPKAKKSFLSSSSKSKAKVINQSTLKSIVGKKYTVGHRNNTACLFSEYEDEDIVDVDIVLFDSSKKIGRGFIVYIHPDLSVELILNYPSTRQDVASYFDVVKKVCHYLNANEFIKDEEATYSVNDIEQLESNTYNFIINYFESYLKEDLGENTYITIGALNLIYLEDHIKDQLLNLSGPALEQAWADYINDKQQLDLYYAKPMFLEHKNGDILGLYALSSTVMSIIPKKPYNPFFSPIPGDTEINQWIIALGRENQSDEVTYIKYETLLEHVDVNTLENYDKDHCIFTLNDALIDTLSAFKVDM